LCKRPTGSKTAYPAEFNTLLASLRAEENALTPAQQELLRYLQAWKSVYDGQYDIAISRLQATIRRYARCHSEIPCPRLDHQRPGVSSHSRSVYDLTQLLVLLPKVTDPAAREQGLMLRTALRRGRTV